MQNPEFQLTGGGWGQIMKLTDGGHTYKLQ